MMSALYVPFGSAVAALHQFLYEQKCIARRRGKANTHRQQIVKTTPQLTAARPSKHSYVFMASENGRRLHGVMVDNTATTDRSKETAGNMRYLYFILKSKKLGRFVCRDKTPTKTCIG